MLTPLHYDLRIEPNLNDFTFEGRVDIRFESTEPAQEIILNCLELAIWECAIKGREKWQPCTFCLLPEKETLRISLPTPVTGIVDVRVTYTGQINDKMAGFYRSATFICTTVTSIKMTCTTWKIIRFTSMNCMRSLIVSIYSSRICCRCSRMTSMTVSWSKISTV